MMGVDGLLKEVEDRRNKALQALEAEYSAKKAEVKKKTDEQVAWVMETATRDGAALSTKESTRVEGAAKLQAKKMTFDATETLLESNMDSLKQALADFAGSSQYGPVLAKMAHYASKRLGGKIKVICRKEDESALKKTGARIESSDLQAIGGFKAESEDGTLELDLTFEEILRSRQDDVRAAILGKD